MSLCPASLPALRRKTFPPAGVYQYEVFERFITLKRVLYTGFHRQIQMSNMSPEF